MARRARFTLATLVALFLVASALPAAPAHADHGPAAELWVAPGRATASTNIGDWATTPSAATNFSFAVPEDFGGLVAAKVLLIGRRTATLSYNLFLSVSSDPLLHNAFTASLPGQVALVTNELREVDVTAVFPALMQAGVDYASLAFVGIESSFARVVGLRVVYNRLRYLADQACAATEFVSGFDAAGDPICTSRTQLLASISCPAGKFLVGFDANGPVCKTLGEVTGDGGGGGGEVPGFSIDDVTQNEGNSGETPFVFTVTLVRPAGTGDDTITVEYMTTSEGADPAATAGEDYVAHSLTTLTFEANETEKTITVLVNGDTDQEPAEKFFVKLSNPQNTSGGTVPTIVKDTGVGTIQNDDLISR